MIIIKEIVNWQPAVTANSSPFVLTKIDNILCDEVK